MSILGKIFKRGGGSSEEITMTEEDAVKFARYVSSVKEREFIETKIGVPIHSFADHQSYLETGYKKVWATFRSCKIISASIISATFKMMLDDGKVEITRPEVTRLLTNPNPYDSWEELLEMWTFHMELTGNAYWLKDEVDVLGRPTAIYPLLPQHMVIYPDPKTKIHHYEYKINGNVIRFEADEIIHFKNPHPNSLHKGMGSIEPSEDLYNSFINRNNLEEKFLENGAQPSGIMTRQMDTQVDPDEFKAMKREFEVKYGGKKNAGKTAFLDGKWNYQKLGLSMVEMQSIEREKMNVEQIFLNHGIPLSVVGIDGAANYATARQDEINFRKYKVVPLIDLLVGKLNTDGSFKGADDRIQLVYELTGLVDVEQIVKEYKPLVDCGAMTRNELREKCNLPVSDNPHLDQFMVAGNTMPIETAGFNDLVDMDDPDAKSARRRRSITLDDE